MNETLTAGIARQRAGWRVLALAGFLLVAGLGCSLGQALVGRTPPTATATRMLQPTFTPGPGVENVPLETSEGPIRGPLPPGVTALPPGTSVAQGSDSSTLVLIATPTSTAGLPSSSPLATGTAAAPSPTAGPTDTPRPTPYVVVGAITITGRRGPGLAYEVVGSASQGQQFMILARNPDSTWWQVCCIANQPAWVPGDRVTAQGPVGVAPAVQPPPTPTPTFTLTPAPTRTITPTPAPPFDIARGPEFPIQRDDGTMVVWVKVYEDATNPKPLAGYMLKVSRNDVDVSLPALSHNRSSGFDSSGAAQGNFEYNLKFEMKGGGEANWEVYLARPDGSRVSPISKFTTLGDSYRNLVVFIAYLLAR